MKHTIAAVATALLLVVAAQAAPAQSLNNQPKAYAAMARTPLAATL